MDLEKAEPLGAGVKAFTEGAPWLETVGVALPITGTSKAEVGVSWRKLCPRNDSTE